MNEPKVQVETSVTVTMTEAQARDVMDDLVHIGEVTGETWFTSNGSEDVYNALAAKLGARQL